jgi:6-pyruvoyltetrahydropterin/6-carboxytetrahydropterin synthase
MNIITLKYDFKFDAAHRLMTYKGPCHNLHGHTWRVQLELLGKVNTATGMLLDFQEIKKIINSTVMAKLDHGAIFNFEDKVLWQNLQALKLKVYTLSGEPTCENLSQVIYEMLNEAFKPYGVYGDGSFWLASVRIWESDHASAIYQAIANPEKETEENV